VVENRQGTQPERDTAGDGEGRPRCLDEQDHGQHEGDEQKREQRFGEDQEVEEDERRIQPADGCSPRADRRPVDARAEDENQDGGGQSKQDLHNADGLQVVGADPPDPRQKRRVEGWPD